MKNNSLARFARALFIFGHFADVVGLCTTWNELFSGCVGDVNIWWQMFNFTFLPLKRLFQFKTKIFSTHFASVMTLNNLEINAETQSYISRWRSSVLSSTCPLLKLPNVTKVNKCTAAANLVFRLVTTRSKFMQASNRKHPDWLNDVGRHDMHEK